MTSAGRLPPCRAIAQAFTTSCAASSASNSRLGCIENSPPHHSIVNGSVRSGAVGYAPICVCEGYPSLARLGNQNGKGPQQYVSIPFFDRIRVHIVRYVLTVPHPVANVWIADFSFRLTRQLMQ